MGSLVRRAEPSARQRAHAPRLGDYVTFNDASLGAKYGARMIPMSILYEAYFDGRIEIHGDLGKFMRKRPHFVKYSLTKHNLEWEAATYPRAPSPQVERANPEFLRMYRDEQGPEFFEGFLGPGLAHTCAAFQSTSRSLKQAQADGHDSICTKLELAAGHRLLDVGCGWGAFTEHAAFRRRATVTGVAASHAQADRARQRLHERGLGEQSRIVTPDERVLPREKFDRIVCLEMVENVLARNVKSFLIALLNRLEDDGSCVLQWTSLRRSMAPEELMWALFMSKFIVPGADAALPIASMLQLVQDAGWHLCSVENASAHYAQTLRRWRHNWETSRARLIERHGERAFRIWHFFLVWSELVVEQGSAACYQLVLSKRQGLSVRRSNGRHHRLSRRPPAC